MLSSNPCPSPVTISVLALYRWGQEVKFKFLCLSKIITTFIFQIFILSTVIYNIVDDMILWPQYFITTTSQEISLTQDGPSSLLLRSVL